MAEIDNVRRAIDAQRCYHYAKPALPALPFTVFAMAIGPEHIDALPRRAIAVEVCRASKDFTAYGSRWRNVRYRHDRFRCFRDLHRAILAPLGGVASKTMRPSFGSLFHSNPFTGQHSNEIFRGLSCRHRPLHLCDSDATLQPACFCSHSAIYRSHHRCRRWVRRCRVIRPVS